MAKKGLAERVATATILIAVASNTLVKGALSVSLGGWALGRRTLASFGVAILGGLGGLAWVWAR
jgi:uncharacterized membrane protein (DUF4010 family)